MPAVPPELLQGLYARWLAVELAPVAIVSDYFASVWEAIHVEHMTYMEGRMFLEAVSGSTLADREDD